MGTEELVKEKRAEILKIAERHGARNVRVFGSVARGEADESSDIDLLVEMDSDRSLLDVTGFVGTCTTAGYAACKKIDDE